MSLKARIDLTRSSGFHLDVDLTIPGRGITALFGHSGSGKTTILRCLAGLEKGGPSDAIDIRFDSEIWQDESSFTPPHQRDIGYVFQEAQLLPHLTVAGNLTYALKRRSSKAGPSMEQVIDWFELGGLITQPVAHLSGGEMQRAAIARALVSGSNLILMDEPLGSLDQGARSRILPYLDNLNRDLNNPILYVSHLLEEIAHLADHMIIIERGSVVAQGAVADLTSRLDLNISHDEHAAAIVQCELVEHDDEYGLSRLTFDGGDLFVTRRREGPGSPIRVRVPARDVSLTLDLPINTSIQNVIESRIDAIEESDSPRLMVRLIAGTQVLLARITRRSVESLQLRPGQKVFAQIKSVALLSEQVHD